MRETDTPPPHRAMFERLAPRYDLINTAISFGLDASWRRAVPRRLPAESRPRRVLDVCCGTGALLAVLARAYPGAALTGLDFSPAMLAEAERRFAGCRVPPPRLVLGDQCDLPFADGAFDLVTNAFGLRNAGDYRRGLAEMRRVLAPGGSLAVLEITRPAPDLSGRLFHLYFDHVAPLIARCLGGDRDAYRYLPASVRGFLTGAALAAEVDEIVGARAALYPLFGRAVSLVVAQRPAAG
ncbi:MAG: ubiquinone/menaquinone biosynthesis methyltransferase [Bacteroidota bacterium]